MGLHEWGPRRPPPKSAVRAMRCACSAIPRDWPRILALAREHGPELLAPDAGAGSPLHCACIDDKPGYVALLLSVGADPSTQDRTGMTALHTAAELGRVHIAELLLAHGANVDGYCSQGYRGTRTSPLALATAAQHLGVVKILLRYHADCGMRDRWGRTPISIARTIYDDHHRHFPKIDV